MAGFDYFDEIPAAVTICDGKGTILYMNKKSSTTFARDGGSSLIGKSLINCHPEPARRKLLALLESHEANSYAIEKNGIHKMIHQTPWFEDGVFKGLIEFSFEIPSDMPHFKRG